MHVRELVELAALVAVHAPVAIEGPGRVPHRSVEEYWAASKCRLERWFRLLRQLTAAAEEPIRPATLSWPRVRPVLEEILAGELLTRLWTATAVAYDARRSDQDLEPIARNIYSSHLDARRRVLQLLADGRAIALTDAVPLNQIRRRVERWGDMLLAHLADHVAVEEFAFEPERARDFAADLNRDAARAERSFTCQLILASLRASFAAGLAERTPNADLNRRIGSAVLGCFREEQFDSTGLVKSLWLERISRTASDTEGMLDELLRLDQMECLPDRLR